MHKHGAGGKISLNTRKPYNINIYYKKLNTVPWSSLFKWLCNTSNNHQQHAFLISA
jgi:hypothetical protein